MIVLKGKKIILRKIRSSDALSICKNANNKEIGRYMPPIKYPYRIKDAREFIEKKKKNFGKEEFSFGIEFNKEIIGMISLIHLDKESKRAEIAYWIGKDYWGKGIGTEAVNIILKFGFKQLKLMRIFGRAMHENIASQKLLEKTGFKYEGTMRKYKFWHGKWMDYLMYSILRDEQKL